jgi:hypothetical protein
VTEGSGTLLVVAVGVNSEWGRTLTIVSESGDEQTPLQVRSAGMGAAGSHWPGTWPKHRWRHVACCALVLFV